MREMSKQERMDLRDRAQSRRQSGGQSPVTESSAGDKLLEELALHKVELEVQCEDLKTALLQAEQHRDLYRQLYDEAPLGLITIEGSGRIYDMNPAARALLGLAPAFSKPVFLQAFVPEQEAEPLALFFRQALKGEGGRTYEVTLLRDSAMRVPARVQAISVMAGERLCLALVDLTEVHKPEQALRESEERFRLANLATNDAIWEWDVAADVVRCTSNMERLFGWADILVSSQPANWWVEKIHPDDRGRVEQDLFNALEGKTATSWADSYRFRCADGRYAEVLDRAYIVRRLDGTPSRMIGAMEDVTERTRTEQALRESEERFRRLVEVSAEMVWTTDADGVPQEDSPSWRAFTGYRLDEWINSNQWLNAFHPEDQERLASAWRHARQTRSQYTIEARLRRADGVYRHIVARALPLLNADGSVRQWVGMNTDITERKQARQDTMRVLSGQIAALARLNELSSRLWRKRSLDEGLGEMLDATIELLGADKGNIQIMNERGVLEIAAERGFDQDFLDFFREVSVQDDSACGRALRSGSRTVIADVDTDDDYRPLRNLARKSGYRAVQSTPLLGRDGQPLGMLSTHWRTVHRPTEIELRRLDLYARQAADFMERLRIDEAMSQSESRFRELVERSPFGIYVVDSHCRISHMNQAGQLGAFRNVRPVIGRDLAEAVRILWPEQVAAEIVRAFRHTLETGEPFCSQDFVNTRADVEQTEGYEWELHRLTMSRGEYGVICYYYDSTKLRIAEEELREAQRRLKGWNMELEQAVSVKTAELSQSQDQLRALAAELNVTEQRERQRLATELHDHLQQLLVLGKMQIGQAKRLLTGVSGSERIMHNLDDLLSQALSYTRTLILEISPPVLREHGLIAGLRWLGQYMDKHHFTVTVQVPDELELKLPDDQVLLLFQSVRELLMNSWKYAGTDQASLTVVRRDDDLQIQVRDDGKGFNPETDVPVPDPQAASSRFGLISIRERMRALGGAFQIHSQPGQGTVATLTLPLREPKALPQATPGAIPASGTVSAVAWPQKNEGSTRVLLVDDHVMMRQGLRTILTGYADLEIVGEAADGAEALAAVERLRPAVVIMDINMPLMNGIEATAHIRSRYPDVSVIGLSVNAAGENQDAMLKAGAAMLMTKEAAVERLYDAVQEVMRGRVAVNAAAV